MTSATLTAARSFTADFLPRLIFEQKKYKTPGDDKRWIARGVLRAMPIVVQHAEYDDEKLLPSDCMPLTFDAGGLRR
jgi:hypothetical protein